MSGNPIKVFDLFGTPVYVTGHYCLLMLFFTYRDLADGAFALAFLTVFAVSASLLVHEFGHVFAARLDGFRSSVAFVGMGALTQPSGRSTGWRAVRLSLAGPAAGLLLGFLAYIVDPPASGLSFLEYASSYQSFRGSESLWPFLQHKLVFIGLFWSIFNLLPIQPMDGGHALRDFLKIFMRAYLADRIAAVVALIFAVPLAIWFFQQGIIFGAAIIGYFAWLNFDSLSRNK